MGFLRLEAILHATSIPSILSIKSPSETLRRRSEVSLHHSGGLIHSITGSRGRELSRNRDSARCPRGGRIIHEVHGKDDYDTLPGKRFFTCKNYEADGLHYRQPWVIGVEEHIERLTRRVEEVEVLIKFVPEVNYKIQRLEGEVQALTREVDSLTGQFYNLSVQVADLEKLCFD
ncbi:hypothetical protein Bca52824_051759 [Brassica carinata]|uniref:Uncharacterized protein n=1 Tax=Brassica carinata TaxID=52824 RepID=A0A8X7R8K7_BRACI|nr:hypothetical protein Bca52824_051759 [Brassica carinata]